MLELYKNIKKLREQKGLSQDELAKMTGYTSRSSIAKIEKGLIDLPQSKIIAFANVLGTKPSILMGWNTTINQNQDEIIIKKNSQESLVIKEMSKMNQRGKNKLLDTAQEMNCSPLYNDNFQEVLSAAHERTDIEVTENAPT